MTLRELEAKFLKSVDARVSQEVDLLIEADGVQFLCPKCFRANKGSIGTHHIRCWSPEVPQDTPPTPGRWNMVGTGIDDLSLVAGSSSVALTSGCMAHFYVKNGKIEDC